MEISTRSGERKRCDYQYHVAYMYSNSVSNDDGCIIPFAQAFYKAPGNLTHPKYRSGRDNGMIEAFNPKASESEAADTKKPLRDLNEV